VIEVGGVGSTSTVGAGNTEGNSLSEGGGVGADDTSGIL
ncbi:hypothetical protein AVEN_15810-1, partial [Araneus ventricosus]